ncbi:MAG: TatD family hydrolase, partial [candidate division KSB1 bacterium]|nr:TatD family hydrolase [candidate division KSB1 bacterium]
MQTVLLLLSLVGAMIAVQGVYLLTHSVQRGVGTMALGAVTGASLFGIWLFANSVPVLHLSNTFSFPLLSLIVYANLLAFLLVVYVCDGTAHTRRLLLVLLAVCLLAIVFQELAALAHRIDAIRNRFPLSELFFNRNWRAMLAAVMVLVLSFLMVISGFQLLTNYFPQLPRGVRVGLVLTVVLLSDGLLYTTLAFAGQPFYGDAMRNQVVSKFFAAVVLTPGAAWYIGRSLRLQAGQQAEFRPVFDVVGGVAEMDREMETILATMVDGLILFSAEGRITRANPAAVRLFGRPLTGLRLDDPLLRMVYPDGSRIPYGDSPMLQMLRTHRAFENVELGIRQADGSLRILSINASPLLDSRQRMRGGLATFRDVTQRKQIDESLAASQEFLRSLIEEAPIGIIVFDHEGVAEAAAEDLMRLAEHPKVVAIGETGFDCYWDDEPLTVQRESFRWHAELACTLGKPLILHVRDKQNRQEASLLAAEQLAALGYERGILHCFNGHAELLKVGLGLGWMVSFAGNLTYKNARELQRAAQQLPRERLLVETDSPYLT